MIRVCDFRGDGYEYFFFLFILYFMATMIERLDITGIAQHALALRQ